MVQKTVDELRIPVRDDSQKQPERWVHMQRVSFQQLQQQQEKQDESEVEGTSDVSILFVHGSMACSEPFHTLVECLGDWINHQTEERRVRRLDCFLFDAYGCGKSRDGLLVASEKENDNVCDKDVLFRWEEFAEAALQEDLIRVVRYILSREEQGKDVVEERKNVWKRSATAKTSTSTSSSSSSLSSLGASPVKPMSTLYIVAHSYGTSQAIKLFSRKQLHPQEEQCIRGFVFMGGAVQPPSSFTDTLAMDHEANDNTTNTDSHDEEVISEKEHAALRNVTKDTVPHPIFRLPVFILHRLQSSMTEQFVQAAYYHPAADNINPTPTPTTTTNDPNKNQPNATSTQHNCVHSTNQVHTLKEKARTLCNANSMQVCKAFYSQRQWATGEDAQALAGKQVHTLVIHGAEDCIVPPCGGRFLSKLFLSPSSTNMNGKNKNQAVEGNVVPRQHDFIVVPHASHQVFEEHPQIVADSVCRFLQETL